MGVQNVMSLSLGEWAATVRGWNKAHGKEKVAPPSVEEFQAAMASSEGRA
jgi:hypothetical protein